MQESGAKTTFSFESLIQSLDFNSIKTLPMAECDGVTRKGELRLKVDQSTEKGETLANLKLKSRNHNKILEETRDIQTSIKVKRIIERPFF